jgi:hypothetical protein
MSMLPRLKTADELLTLVERIGFLPLFKNPIAGFSVEEATVPSHWFDGHAHDPWRWRKEVAEGRDAAYGKFFQKKAGFITKSWLPRFVNARRDGYDFDALYDDGKAPFAHKRIMDHFIAEDGIVLPSHILKQRAGFSAKGGESFEGALTQLQMQTYLCICGFAQKRNKRDEPYGWAVSQYATPESVFGVDHIRSDYDTKPQASFASIVEQASKIATDATQMQLQKLLK